MESVLLILVKSLFIIEALQSMGKSLIVLTKRNQPATLTVGQNIKGFAEGLKLMQEGSEYIFYIPQDLGYGEQEAGAIKPYSTMIFDVKLLKVKNE
jgi:FKBP-type peptidyl-prolyl cis-trans isomerase 2